MRSAARPTVRYFRPLQVGGAVDRLLEPAERLGRHRHREEALDVDLHDLGLELLEQLLAAAVVDPAEALVGVEAEHRAGAEQRGRLVLAVPVDGHGVGGVDLAAMHAVEDLERMHDRAADEVVDLEPPAGHVVDALDVVHRHLVEDVLGAPGALHLQGGGLRARHLRHGDGGGARDRRSGQELAAAGEWVCSLVIRISLPRDFTIVLGDSGLRGRLEYNMPRRFRAHKRAWPFRQPSLTGC